MRVDITSVSGPLCHSWHGKPLSPDPCLHPSCWAAATSVVRPSWFYVPPDDEPPG